jgi:hypothetical protein
MRACAGVKVVFWLAWTEARATGAETATAAERVWQDMWEG